MMISELAADKMFSSLKKLSDFAQESCLAFPNSGASDEVVKEHRSLMSEILGRAYDPFLYTLIQKFDVATMERLRERVPLSTPMSVRELMVAVVVEGDLLFDQFGDLMRKGESEGFFRDGGVENLSEDLRRFKDWLAKNQHEIAS